MPNRCVRITLRSAIPAAIAALAPLATAASQAGNSPTVFRRPTVPTAPYTGAVEPQSFSGLRYRSIGPARGGRVTAVAGVPSQPYTFYFGSTGGGVWKTVDAGQSWMNVTDGQIGLLADGERGAQGAFESVLAGKHQAPAGAGGGDQTAGRGSGSTLRARIQRLGFLLEEPVEPVIQGARRALRELFEAGAILFQQIAR